MASGLPWMQGRQGYFDNVTIIDAYGSVVAEVQMAPREAAVDAANDIVRAVNAHDGLVAAVDGLLTLLAHENCDACRRGCATDYYDHDEVRVARAALAAARERGE